MNRNRASLSMTAVCCPLFRPACFFLVALMLCFETAMAQIMDLHSGKTILSQEIILAFPLGPG